MKIEVVDVPKTPPTFTPQTLVLTVETKREAMLVRHLLGCWVAPELCGQDRQAVMNLARDIIDQVRHWPTV